MQQRTLLLLALVTAPIATASFVSASSSATAWLQSHKSPTDDQLGELQSANPAAFALVSALLNKHAKGQLKLAPEERGPDVFRNMMTPRHLSAAQPNVAVPYASAGLAEISRPVIDQAHYNPNTAADRDESSVSRLLAAVAQLGGAKGKKIALLNHRRQKDTQVDDALLKDSSIFGDADPAPAPVQTVEAQVMAAVQPPVQEQAAPAPKRENSYLKGIDLSGDMPVASTAHKHTHTFSHDDGPSSLASFSFDDSAPATPAPKQVAAPKPKKENSFLKWLSGTKKVPAPVEAEKPAQQVAQKNPYAGWLGN